MTSAILVYVLPMMLGQTYNKGSETPGIQIFNDSTVTHSKKIEHYFTDSQYRMVENYKDIRDFLDVKGKLSLKIKSGMVDVEGEGSYLKDSSTKSNAIEILVKVHFESITRTIPTSWKPNMDWSLQDKKFLGTHYCRSISYGGDLIASVTFTTNNVFDKERIKGALRAGLNAKGIDAGLKGQLEILKSEVHDGSSMEIKYYATVPIPRISYTIEGLLKEIEEFPKHVQQVNGGLGNPMRMELYPLTSLESTFPMYLENGALNDQLDDLEDQYDDLRTARKETMHWISSMPPNIAQSVRDKVNSFLTKLESIYGTFLNSIFDLDLSVDSSTKPFDEAFKAYADGGYTFNNKYNRKLKLLQKDIYQKFPELKPKYGGASYVQWGRISCGTPNDIKTELSGVIITSEHNTVGGSSEFKCSPKQLNLRNPKDYFKDYDTETDKNANLSITPVKYNGELQKISKMLNRIIPCAVCRVKKRTTTLVLQAQSSCPDGWTKEYQGLLMAPGPSDLKGDYICVDEDIQVSTEVNFEKTKESKSISIQEVSILCGTLPCGPYKPKTPISCVVCTR